MKDNIQPVIFIDGKCLKCGKMCGNGGAGPLKCECGWVEGEPSKKLKGAIDKIFREEFGDEDNV